MCSACFDDVFASHIICQCHIDAVKTMEWPQLIMIAAYDAEYPRYEP